MKRATERRSRPGERFALWRDCRTLTIVHMGSRTLKGVLEGAYGNPQKIISLRQRAKQVAIASMDE
jgi:hypothetical protein